MRPGRAVRVRGGARALDICAEAGRLGCGVDLGTGDNLPTITERAIKADPVGGDIPDPGELIPLSEYVEGGRTKTVVDAVRICAKRCGGDVAVCGGIKGPLGVLAQMMGTENMALSVMLAPDKVRRWTDVLTPYQREYTRAMRDAGADVICVVEGVASPDVIGPDAFVEACGRHIRDVMPGGDTRTVLHICGSTEPILERISRTGADAFLPDNRVAADEVVSAMGGRMAAVGAVDPVGTLLMHGPERVAEEARMYADAGYAVIGPGCGLAPRTPDANLRALAGAFRRAGSQNGYTAPRLTRTWASALLSWERAAGVTPPCTRPAAPAASWWSTTAASCTSIPARGP